MDTVCFNAEKFYRIAFDYFFYESNIPLAKKYINRALKFDKNHFKSLLLKGQAFLVENKIKLSEKYLLKAHNLNPEDEKCLSYLAVIHDLKEDYKEALKYINKVFDKEIEDKEFLGECYRLKISLLINLNEFDKAESTFKTLNYKLYSDDVFHIGETFRGLLNGRAAESFKQEKLGTRKNKGRILHINF